MAVLRMPAGPRRPGEERRRRKEAAKSGKPTGRAAGGLTGSFVARIAVVTGICAGAFLRAPFYRRTNEFWRTWFKAIEL
jgi:hypothetical protein